MTTPALWGKPKRHRKNKDILIWKGRKGARVYAPTGGKLIKTEAGLVIKTKRGYTHTLVGATPFPRLDNKNVKAGQYIGRMNRRALRYVRRNPAEKILDAMHQVKRDNHPRPRWFPNVPKMPATKAGDMDTAPGDERVAVWHTTESGNAPGTIRAVAQYIIDNEKSYHLLWNPWTGEIIVLYPTDVGARCVSNASNPYLATNRHGAVRFQISIVGRASTKPLAGGSPMKGRRKVMQHLDRWGIPRVNISDPGRRSRTKWVQSGHTTHGSCPDNDHTDPGSVNWRKLFQP